MKIKNKKTLIPLLLIALAAIGGAVYIKSDQYQRARTDRIAEENHAKNDSPSNAPDSSEPTNTGEGSNNQAAGTSPATSPPSKPTLLKSSGNRSAVPAGSKIQFICQADIGAKCTILLSNSNGTKIDLGQKTVTDDRTSQSAVDWYWDSLSGSWTVTAKASNSAGSTSSDSQSLEVK